MPRVIETLEVTKANQESLPAFSKMLRKFYEQLARVINGKISFGNGIDPDNVHGVWYSNTTPVTANTGFTITHNLGYIPLGWLVVYQDKAGDIYDAGTAWTKTQIFLKCSGSSVAVKLFII